eukprot:Partr_v1_DN25384_c1_g5_i6_m21965
MIVTQAAVDPEIVRDFKVRAGCDIIQSFPCDSENSSRCDIRELLRVLFRDYGVDHLMVEGGSEILEWFLNSGRDVIDHLIITISPVYLGRNGVRVSSNDGSLIEYLSSNGKSIEWYQTGSDCMLLIMP